PDYFEGVYFPDTYLIPTSSTPAEVAARLVAQFNTSFAPYAAEALQQNIKWTTALTLASIIQREAAGPQDMALVSGILWNRLLATPPMKLQVDSTVQYARGNADAATGSDGWWAPIAPADESINSPYNTYLNAGLPPHPISDPGLDAIAAALNPASTSCLYYIHDASGTIHCSATYAGQQANIQEYLQ
ncbi:MAG TPA: endolytic transglycosylase MltG, partial [Candidatus Paceibacterota bacterium]|nr:endolytic transglycosylase MltG [Candidatus Paceibacterota bacterium]